MEASHSPPSNGLNDSLVDFCLTGNQRPILTVCITGALALCVPARSLSGGLMSLPSLRPNVRVCSPDRKCMRTWPLVIGGNTRKDTGARSCVLPEIPFSFSTLANFTSVTNTLL